MEVLQTGSSEGRDQVLLRPLQPDTSLASFSSDTRLTAVYLVELAIHITKEILAASLCLPLRRLNVP
jgi:hypothetical protein